MKPIKNRVFCKVCNRSKMLFNSKKEALRFIEFNASEIKEQNGFAPTRAYYCVLCGGWHVTSQSRGLAKAKLDEAFKHIARFKKYILKQDTCKVNMEYQKTFRFLSEAIEFKGEDERKQLAFQELMMCHQWFLAKIAA